MNASRIVWLPLVAATILGFAAGPGAAQKPPAAQTPPAAAVPNDPFGEQVMLTEKTILYVAGSGLWDTAFETIQGGFKDVYGAMQKLGIKDAGAPMTIYTATDDTGFQFQAAVPVAQAPSPLPEGAVKVGKSPSGKALKFVHRGSYDSMDTTYDAITNYLDEKQLDAMELFIEQYMKNPLTTPEDDLVIEIYVPIK
jgi:effector-binding domain-containing protein